MNKKYLELTKLIRSKQNDHEILKCLSNYHENDIADMLTVMTPKERKRIYTLLGPQKIAEIFAYLDEPQIYFSELSVKDAAKVVSLMPLTSSKHSTIKRNMKSWKTWTKLP